MAGKFGNALSFDGSSDDASKVDFGTDSRGDFDGIFSLSFWVKPTSAGNVNLIDNKSASTSPGFQIYLTSSSNRLYVR